MMGKPWARFKRHAHLAQKVRDVAETDNLVPEHDATGIDQATRVESIFWQASQLSSDIDRRAYLDNACKHDGDLRRQVEEMLAVAPFAEQFAEAYAPTLATPVDEYLGSTIGPYKLREKVGEGGMGVVYVAEQKQPLKRRVALKIIKPGMDSRQIIARFQAERESLALMDHPHIARVLDAGTTDRGLPYFVMELVRGVPITEYADKQRLTLEERLQLFQDVCRAVQHAHMKGIIHRDIKPSNVLVTLHDGKPVVKMIDFGVAKAMGRQFNEHSVYTGLGQMVGTPMYMSPEQAELSGLDVDTRSDVYSLGVLLYELITGMTPFDRDSFRAAGLDAMLRIIREQEPPKPSLRLSTVKNELRSTIADSRRVDTKQLNYRLRGELDWIVMKSLEKQRERRYQSAREFADDLGRFLSDDIIQARPPSAWYRLQKLLRKHRPAFVVTFLITLGLCIAFVGITSGLIAVTKQRNLARENLALALYNEANALRIARVPGYRERVSQLLHRSRLEGPRVVTADMAKHALTAGMGDFVAFAPHQTRLPDGGITHTFDPWSSRVIWTDAQGQLTLIDFDGNTVVLDAAPVSPVIMVRFDPSGRSLAVVEETGKIRLFHEKEAWQGKPVLVPEGITLRDVSVMEDAKGVIVCGSQGNTLIAAHCETRAAAEILTRFESSASIRDAGLSRNGQQLVMRDRNARTHVFQVGTSVPFRQVSSGSSVPAFRRSIGSGAVVLSKMCVSQDGDLIIYGLRHGLEIVDGDGIRLVPEAANTSIAISPSGDLFASLTATGTLEIWNAKSQKILGKLDVDPLDFSRAKLFFSSDSSRVFAVSNRLIGAWQLSTPERVRLYGHRAGVPSVAFNSTGELLATASGDGAVRVWVSATGRKKSEFRDFFYPESVTFGPQDDLVIGDQDGRILVRSLGTNASQTIRQEHPGETYSVATSADGQFIAAADFVDRVQLFRRENSGEFSLVREFEGTGTVRFSADDRQLLWLTFEPERGFFVNGFDLVAQRELKDLPPQPVKFSLKTIAVNNRGELLFVSPVTDERKTHGGDTRDRLVIWDLRQRELVADQPVHVPGIPQPSSQDGVPHWDTYGLIASSEDGQYLATTLNRAHVVIWKRSGTVYEVEWLLPQESDAIWSLAWSPDATKLAVGTSGAEVSIWNLTSLREQLRGFDWLR